MAKINGNEILFGANILTLKAEGTIGVIEIENGYRITVTDRDGTKSIDLFHGKDGGSPEDLKQYVDSRINEISKEVVNITTIDETYETVADLPTNKENGTRLVVLSEKAIYTWDANSDKWVLADTFRPHTLYCVLSGEKSGIYRYTMAKPYLVLAEQAAIEIANAYTDEKVDDTVPHMSAIDAKRIKAYEEDGGYYFSENNWKGFIGDEASGKFGCNRVYVERSKERGTYGMYALSYNDNPIYNAWYSKSEWSQRFAKEHPGEAFREPYDNEYPLLDSIVQRNKDGSVIVRLIPLDDREAVSLYYLKMVNKGFEEKLAELKSNYGDMLNEVYAGTEGLAYVLSSDGTHYICTGLGDVPTNSDIEIAGYIDGIPVTEIGSGAFNNKAIRSVRVPTTMNKFNYNAFGWSGAVGAVYVKDLAKWAVATFESSGTPVTANENPPKVYIKGRYLTELVIPEGVIKVNRRAFTHWKQFESLVLPTTVSYIDEMAFQYCKGFKSLTIPENVQTLSASSFGYCSALKEVRFKGKPSDLSIATFEGDTALTDIYVPWSKGAVEGENVKWGATYATIHYNSEV